MDPSPVLLLLDLLLPPLWFEIHGHVFRLALRVLLVLGGAGERTLRWKPVGRGIRVDSVVKVPGVH